MTSLAEKICLRLAQMKGERAKSEPAWRSCFEFTYPERMEGLGGSGVDASFAQQKKTEILDNVGTDGVRMLASNVMGGMTPANAVWLGFDVPDETEEERRWLDHAAEEVWLAIHQSNYDSQKYEAIVDSLCAGWFVLFIEDRNGRPFFLQYPLGQCFIACSMLGGPADILYRSFQMTAEQAVNEYGDKVSQTIKDQAADTAKCSTKHEFVHATYPRTKYTPGSKLPRNMAFASVHVEVAGKNVVRESGFNEQPFVCPRWMVLPDSPYALGPVSNALGNIRELQALLALEKVALGRAAAGVYIAEDDGVLNPRNVRVKGGTVIVANSVNSIKELPTGADFNVTFSKADQLRAEIRRMLLADQLAPQDGPAMTATEVHVRVALIRQLLGPLYGRFQSEDLAPTIDRVFGMMYRQGRPELGGEPGPVLIDDAPETLAGVKFSNRYLSPLARAQKLEDVTAIERVTAIAGTMAELGKPETLDLIDGEQSIRLAADALGAPAKMLRTEKGLIAYRQQREQTQQQEQQAAQQQQLQTMSVQATLDRASQPV
ncbi:hypothetical protein CDN99_06610 [Roseateles aquatilis]|uniref:Phage tail protein n=1 Tax=Roseateles aquatilis TaxID=431061 RepID=A0A246JHC5_9BURK|nr:portal protein [Roseateles aquatilis]OWQ92024.1 hypothetical protein CDN99_06610 [Roseateles aquatilis]